MFKGYIAYKQCNGNLMLTLIKNDDSNLATIENDSLQCQISVPNLVTMLSQHPDNYVFIKDHQSLHQIANSNYLKLFGMRRNQDLQTKSDYDLCGDKTQSKIYQDLDQEVLDTNQVLDVTEEVIPEDDPSIRITMTGKIYPLQVNSHKANYVIGVVQQQSKLLLRHLDDLLRLTASEICALLTKRSYNIKVQWGNIIAGKREIQCLIELIKGKHAGEIASSFNLKQSTIESYLTSIKNKLGVCSRSELIGMALSSNVLQQVFI